MEIKLSVDLPTVGVQEGRLVGVDMVMVCAAGGTEAGMKVVCHPLYLGYGNVRWQNLVQLVCQLWTVNFSGVKMGRHRAGMHSGIRTAGAHNFHFAAQKGGQPFLQCFLHADAVGLYLPTVVACAVIRKVYEISHRLFCSFRTILISAAKVRKYG